LTVPPFCELTVNGSVSMKMVVTDAMLIGVGVGAPGPPGVKVRVTVNVGPAPWTDMRTEPEMLPELGDAVAVSRAEPPSMPVTEPWKRPCALVMPLAGRRR
jgi:hypothetical protein